ncbi:hypothetical protein [Sporomusa sp.]|uniref:hypothetical protein n=1 Tax=Sporomusa sp. TaxID=2078658 RepID=UPI002BCF9C34|nr:hypothetical protein [Sporomusa sp.]HWR45809.1 hypothetical protein [Sporomusa sp.]
MDIIYDLLTIKRSSRQDYPKPFLAALGEEFPRKLAAHMAAMFSEWGFGRCYRDEIPDLTRHSPLRTTVMERAFQVEQKGEEHGDI